MADKQASGANAVGHKGVVSAVTTALIDLFSNKGQLPPLPDSIRMDGKTCLVTGANSGLGKAVATQLAERGAHVIMACRSGIPEAGEEIRQRTGNPNVEMIQVDLSDTRSVHRFCDELRDREIHLDVFIANAGLMPLQARRTPQDLEIMFAVHFLANRIIARRLIADGVIQPNKKHPPRMIFVSSDAHQSSDPIDFDRFAEFVHYGMKDGMKHYAYTKLHLCTFVHELSARLNRDGEVSVAVHALCPGPIASNIARESPAFLKPILGPIMKLFFNSPEKAAAPVMLLACSPEMGQRTDVYLHMMREKETSPLARDPQNRQKLWEKSEALMQQLEKTTTT